MRNPTVTPVTATFSNVLAENDGASRILDLAVSEEVMELRCLQGPGQQHQRWTIGVRP